MKRYLFGFVFLCFCGSVFGQARWEYCELVLSQKPFGKGHNLEVEGAVCDSMPRRWETVGLFLGYLSSGGWEVDLVDVDWDKQVGLVAVRRVYFLRRRVGE